MTRKDVNRACAARTLIGACTFAGVIVGLDWGTELLVRILTS